MRWRAALLAGALLAGPLVACGGDTTIVPDLGPTGVPRLSFIGLESEEGSPCLELGEDLTLPAPLLVEVSEVVLRPPGGCGERVQCGYLRLLADGVPNAESSVLSVGFRPDRLADPIRDGRPHAGTGEPDLLTLRVEIVTEADDVLVDPFSGDEVADEVMVRTVPDCSVPAPEAP